jgi:leucyl-tRNA synthetase
MEADLATVEKKGMPAGLFVRHPLTGAKIEVWVGNYVLMSYGEGAVMAVPGHDERDFAFAKKYGLAIKPVIDVDGQRYSTDEWQPWYEMPGRNVNSGKYDGLGQKAAIDTVARDLEALGLGAKRVQYRLRDWGISRQRYWGTPIPIVMCPKCGDVAVPDGELPVVLPENLVPDGSGSPLAKTPSFFETRCPKCGGAAKRDTDTMDTFVDSSWYFMRYASANAKTMVDERAQYWMPLDMYIGGIEHAILHLLYARFWTKAMRDMGLVKVDEPFANLLTQGMVLNHIFSRRTARGAIEYFAPDEIDVTLDAEGNVKGATLKSDGSAIDYEGVGTMSKSKRNGVDPNDMIERYGADTARFYVMQASPPSDTVLWSDESVEGSFKFLRRLWTMVHDHVKDGVAKREAPADLSKEMKELRFKLHKTIEKVADDYGRRLQFNTAIAAVRELLNLYTDLKDRSPAARAVAQEVLEDSILLLSPIVPHITTALWAELRPGTRLLDQPWPAVDENALAQDTIQLVVQVNGKLRGHLNVPASASREQIEAFALADETVQKFVNGQKPKKIVVVPGRLVNIVV